MYQIVIARVNAPYDDANTYNKYPIIKIFINLRGLRSITNYLTERQQSKLTITAVRYIVDKNVSNY